MKNINNEPIYFNEIAEKTKIDAKKHDLFLILMVIIALGTVVYSMFVIQKDIEAGMIPLFHITIPAGILLIQAIVLFVWSFFIKETDNEIEYRRKVVLAYKLDIHPPLSIDDFEKLRGKPL